jgi:hypothetical protein
MKWDIDVFWSKKERLLLGIDMITMNGIGSSPTTLRGENH